MESILKSIVSTYLYKNNKNDVGVNDKNENSLTMDDRIQLISSENYTINDFNNILNLEYNNSLDIEDNIFNDLEFFIDNDLSVDNTIFKKINNTTTVFGTICKNKIIMNPINDISILTKRQNLVKNILKLESYDRINELLIDSNNLQKNIIWFWKHANSSHLDILCEMVYFNITNIFFINDRLNSSPDILSISNFYSVYINPIITISSPIISILIPLIILYWIQRKTNTNISVWTLFKFALKNLFNFNQFDIVVKNKFKAKIMSLLSTGLWIFFYFQNVSASIKTSKNTNKVISIINNKVSSVNKFIMNVQEISNLLNINNDELVELFDIKFDFKNILNKFLYNLKRNYSTISYQKGHILKDFKILLEIKNDLSNLMKYIGIIDVLFSNSKLIRNNKYCFAKYITDSKHPIISTNNIYHPYLENSVKNNINIKSKNLIITGPNAAGKSTFIKTLSVNVLLAQSLGLSSSDNFSLTPFKLIETYLHIPDINGISSLFENEMNKSKQYINKVKLLNNGEYSFIVMDEIFSSTNHIEGSSGAYAILKSLSKYKNNITVITTHYESLTKLEKNTKKRFINYKFEINRDNNGDIIYDYKIKRGSSNQTIALELLKKNNFDSDIINEAIKFSKIITNDNKNENKQTTENKQTNENNENKEKKQKKQKKDKNLKSLDIVLQEEQILI